MLNLEAIGVPIASITDGPLKGKKVHVAISEQEQEAPTQMPFMSIDLRKTHKNAKFEVLPNPKIEREIGYITGASGSGKSYFCAKYIDKWHKAHRDKPIYLFSKITDDEKINQYNPIRIKLDMHLLDDHIDACDFEPNSLVIFDDIDSIKEKKIKDEVYNIMNTILQEGRHFNVSCLITSHAPTDRQRTKLIFNEAHFIVYFPYGSSPKQINYMLESHAGMTKDHIEHCFHAGTRWVVYKRHYPPHIITEHEIFFNHKKRPKKPKNSNDDDEAQ